MKWENIKAGDHVEFKWEKGLPYLYYVPGKVKRVAYGKGTPNTVYVIQDNGRGDETEFWFNKEDFEKGLIRDRRPALRWRNIKVGDKVEFEIAIGKDFEIYAINDWTKSLFVQNKKRAETVVGTAARFSEYYGTVEVHISSGQGTYCFEEADVEKGYIRAPRDSEPISSESNCFFCQKPTKTIKVSDLITYNHCENPSCNKE